MENESLLTVGKPDRPMRIAIDLNEVVRDYLGKFLKLYRKYVDAWCTLRREDITTNRLDQAFPFDSYGDYEQFRYVDYVYELSCRADTMEPHLAARFNDWCTKTMKDFDDEDVPELIIVSPFEDHLSIQSTYAFLAAIGCRVREVYFPVDSMTIWDRCDLLITANPRLISNVPEGKTVIKIDAPYNVHAAADLSFPSLMELMTDDKHTVTDMVENWR